jgi:hypothetical protein
MKMPESKVNDILIAGMRGVKQLALKKTEPSGEGSSGGGRPEDEDK